MLTRAELATIEAALSARVTDAGLPDPERSSDEVTSQGKRIDEALALVRRETQLDDTVVLTSREEQILGLLIRGHGRREAALCAGICDRTFDTHRAHLLRKLGLRGNVELAFWALQHGRISTEELSSVWARPRGPDLDPERMPAPAPECLDLRCLDLRAEGSP